MSAPKRSSGHRTKPRETRRTLEPARVSPPRSLHRAGRAAWRRALRSAPWVAAESDFDLLRVYAGLFDERNALVSTIETDGRTVIGSTGQPRSSPAVGQLREVEAAIWRAAAALGLGPAARRRITGRLDVEREKPKLAEVRDLYADLEAS